jgi:hypothetical protein
LHYYGCLGGKAGGLPLVLVPSGIVVGKPVVGDIVVGVVAVGVSLGGVAGFSGFVLAGVAGFFLSTAFLSVAVSFFCSGVCAAWSVLGRFLPVCVLVLSVCADAIPKTSIAPSVINNFFMLIELIVIAF